MPKSKTTDAGLLADAIEREGIERVVYGKGLAEMGAINRLLVDGLNALDTTPPYVLPPAWIPVSERLPEVPLGKEQLVWICWEGDNGKRTVCDLWYVNRPYSEEYDGASWVIENESTGDGMDCVGWYEFGCSSSDDEFFMPFDRPQQIIAWMPIDKPDAPASISLSPTKEKS